MKYINTWRPDTCGCELHYEWDDTVPIEERVHVPVNDFVDSSGNRRVHKFCKDHDGITDYKELHEHVGGENRSKNMFLAHILDNHPRLVDVRDDGGGEAKHLKKHVKYEYTFSGKDKNRKLSVSLTGANLTEAEKASMKPHIEKFEKTVEII